METYEYLQGLDDDLLDPDMPEDMVDDELRSMGLSPEEIAEEGVLFVKELQSKLDPEGG
jgi:hypothetical protein